MGNILRDRVVHATRAHLPIVCDRLRACALDEGSALPAAFTVAQSP